MKLIIQIPCYNEEQALPGTLRDLPRTLPGIDAVEVLVVDDGSTDKTAAVAVKSGADHVLRLKRNRGLAKAFAAGLERALELGADIIVNTDADNQYCGADVAALVGPIIRDEADVVVGDRQVAHMAHFSNMKKFLEKTGSAFVRRLSSTDVADVVSGFRAFSREAALHVNVLTDFSYTVENLIQLGSQKFRILSVPVRTSAPVRKSRLHKGIFHFVVNQVRTMVRSYAMYKALKTFSFIGLLFFLPGVALGLRFLYFFFFTSHSTAGHVQSLILAAILIILSFIFFMMGILADLISANRKLVEKLLVESRRSGKTRLSMKD